MPGTRRGTFIVSSNQNNQISDCDLALNSIAKEQFLENADHEYVAARSDYRIGLRDQFFWHSLHAIEKYLKGILLYHRNDINSMIGTNKRSLRSFSHNIIDLCEACKAISVIDFHVDTSTQTFLDRLHHVGKNRYLVNSTLIRPDDLHDFDSAVWQIRLFVQNTPDAIRFIRNQSGQVFKPPLRYNNTIGKPQLTSQGWLEQLQRTPVSSHNKDISDALLWGNNYFISFGGQPVPATHTYSSSYVAITDRGWASSSTVQDAIISYVGK